MLVSAPRRRDRFRAKRTTAIIERQPVGPNVRPSSRARGIPRRPRPHLRGELWQALPTDRPWRTAGHSGRQPRRNIRHIPLPKDRQAGMRHLVSPRSPILRFAQRRWRQPRYPCQPRRLQVRPGRPAEWPIRRLALIRRQHTHSGWATPASTKKRRVMGSIKRAWVLSRRIMLAEMTERVG